MRDPTPHTHTTHTRTQHTHAQVLSHHVELRRSGHRRPDSRMAQGALQRRPHASSVHHGGKPWGHLPRLDAHEHGARRPSQGVFGQAWRSIGAIWSRGTRTTSRWWTSRGSECNRKKEGGRSQSGLAPERRRSFSFVI